MISAPTSPVPVSTLATGYRRALANLISRFREQSSQGLVLSPHGIGSVFCLCWMKLDPINRLSQFYGLCRAQLISDISDWGYSGWVELA